MRNSWLRLLAIPAAVQAVSLALKLAGVTRWPWWLVLAPAWVTAIIAAAFAALLFTALGTWGR